MPVRAVPSSVIVRNRLRIGVVTTFIFALIVAVASFFAMQSIRDSKDFVTHKHVTDLLNAKNLVIALESRSLNTRTYLLTGDKSFLRQSTFDRGVISKILDDLHRSVQSSKGVGTFDEVERATEEHQRKSDQVLKLKNEGRSALALRYFKTEVVPSRVIMTDAVDRFVRYKQYLYDQARAESARAVERTMVWFGVISGIAIILAIVLGFVLYGTFLGLYRRMEKALNDLAYSEASKAGIMDSALDCIITMDHRGSVVEFNPAAERTFGYRREEVLGKEMASMIIGPELRQAHRAGLSRYLSTGSGPIMNKRVEMPAMRADGSVFPIELAVTRIGTTENPTFAGFIRDITEKKRTENAMLEAIRARDELVGVVSHELKNPLTAMSTSLELIFRLREKDTKGPIVDKMMEQMRSNVRRMTRITSDLLDFTKIEANRLPLMQARNDVGAILDEVVESLRPSAMEKNILLEKILLAEPITAFCDRERIIQVLFNLIGNAIKFSAEGTTVVVRAFTDGKLVRFEVQDQGPGIPEDQQDKVFDRFWQAKETAFKGSGLGLPIAKGIVKAHGGKIGLISRQGVGSTFFFTLKTDEGADSPQSIAS